VKKSMKLIFGTGGLFLLAMSGVTLAASGVESAKKDVAWPAASIKWEAGPTPGTKVAKLWGDWTKDEAYGVLIKFDAGLMHPLHKHTYDLKIITISGTYVHTPEGGTEVRLGPGSYLLQAGGKNHVSGCATGPECEFFMTSTGKFDLIPVKKSPAPAASTK
jgi:quercetin dioxygenase-like cupin family protein